TGSVQVINEQGNKALRLYRNNKYPGRNANFAGEIKSDAGRFLSFEMVFSSIPQTVSYTNEQITLSSGDLENNIAGLSIINGEFRTGASGSLTYLDNPVTFISGKKYYVKFVIDRYSKTYDIYISNSGFDGTPVAIGVPLQSVNQSELYASFSCFKYSIHLDNSNYQGGTVLIHKVFAMGFSDEPEPGFIIGDTMFEEKDNNITASVLFAGKNAKGMCLLAGYSRNSTLEGLNWAEYNQVAGGAQMLRVNLPKTEDNSYRTFIWDSFAGLKPISPYIP
ncbi:MAG: hypothetical protein LBJ74_02440, partial [Heliobacteriaceae bacterium]|nr:hypothetical protein [Heliobacteriaceae bacterium]